MIWQQIAAIAWAQFRTARNHLPRTSVGAVLVWILSLLWYGLFAALAYLVAYVIPELPISEVRDWMPVGLLGVFAFWQLVPLFTLSSGWSLQLNKLLTYPVPTGSLFGIEVLLRITSAPEMVLILTGAVAGLLRHPGVPVWSALAMYLFIPFNLFLSLAIRELILHSFDRKGFRELFAVLLVSIGILPQILFSGKHEISPRYLMFARARFTPWHGFAALSTGRISASDILQILLWTAAAYLLARWQFQLSLRQDDAFRAGTSSSTNKKANATPSLSRQLAAIPDRLFQDPMAAMLKKEFQSLLRMPRFRVMFGMACVFSVLIFIPMMLNSLTGGEHSFISSNFLIVVTLYGVLLMSDSLLLNIFGFDRQATQIYFIAPISLETVIKAKNLIAVTFIALQSSIVLAFAALIRVPLSMSHILDAISASAVVGLFFLCIGNLTSIAMARPIDPTQTFRKQAGGKMQLWFLLCSLGMFLLVGFAFLARWALQSNWAMSAVLAVEFGIGLIIYRISMQSALEHATRERERMLDSLSKGASQSLST